jgi:hypothetical protein
MERKPRVLERYGFAIASGVVVVGLAFAIPISTAGSSVTAVPTTIPIALEPVPVGATPPADVVPGSETNPTHVGPPAVTTATVACSPGEITATFNGPGPYNYAPGYGQFIVDLTSTAPCYLSGYPTLSVSTASAVGGQSSLGSTDGGYQGTNGGISDVTLAQDSPASFLIQFQTSPDCAGSSDFSFQLADSSDSIPINMKDVGIPVCSSVIVSPFTQGSTSDRYYQ